jgi:hypothetical protein
VEVASSNFPKFARNLNTGGVIARETSPLVAENSVHHDRVEASYIELPVIR